MYRLKYSPEQIAAILLLLIGMVAAKFEIFASGKRAKLGINDASLLPSYDLKKISIDESLKTRNLTAFTAATLHVILGIDKYSFYGFGDNFNGRLHRNLPRIQFFQPTLLPVPQDTVPGASELNSKFDFPLLLEDFTFLFKNSLYMNLTNRDMVMKTFGFPDHPVDSFPKTPVTDVKYFERTKSGKKDEKHAPPLTSRNPRGWIYPWGNRNPLSGILHFGYTFGIGGDFTLDDLWDFKENKILDPYMTTIMKIQTLQDVFIVLDSQGWLFQWGFDKSKVLTGQILIKPHTYTLDMGASGGKALAGKNPSLFMKPERIVTNPDLSSEYGRFINFYTGKYGTIGVTFDKKFVVWGKNPYNMLGASNYNPNEDSVQPPRFIDQIQTGWPSYDQIRQISIGDEHTLILKTDNTVWGIGSNKNGELAQASQESSFTKLVQLQFPVGSAEDLCLKAGTCTIDMIFAGTESSFIGVTYKDAQSGVSILPTCFGISHLESKACSGHGFCINMDKCSCMRGYYGTQCENTYDCSGVNQCSGRGVCVKQNTCACFLASATGPDCSTPQCDYNYLDAVICSGKGRCAFKKTPSGTDGERSECICDPGWSGLFCGNGPASPLLYGAGSSSFGQTGTDSLNETVPTFQRVSFELTEHRDSFKITHFHTSKNFTSMVYGGYLHTIPTKDTFAAYYGYLGGTADLFSTVPAPYPLLGKDNKETDFKSIAVDGAAAGVDQNKQVIILSEMVRDIGFNTKPKLLLSGDLTADKIYVNQDAFFLLKDGIVTERLHYTYQMTRVPFLGHTSVGSKLLRCCTTHEQIICLSSAGEAFLHVTGLSESSTLLLNQTVIDMVCAPYAAALRTQNKQYYTFGNSKYNHLGNGLAKTSYKEIALATEFSKVPEGQEIIDLSIGTTHSLMLTKETSNPSKKHLFAIGENVGNCFGFVGAPLFSEKWIEVPLDPKVVAVDKITKVQAGDGVSYLGVWGEASNYMECAGVSAELTDKVCGGHGLCIAEKCMCSEGYSNWDDTQPTLKLILQPIVANPLFYYIMELMSLQVDALKPNTCVAADEIEAIFFFVLCSYVFMFVLIACLGSCFIIIVGSFIGCAIFWCVILVTCGGCGGLIWCQKLSETLKRKRQKNELIEKLLENDGTELGDTEMSKDVDMTLFNLDFNDFKVVTEIGTGGSGALCLEAIDKRTDEKVFIKLFVLKKEEGTNKLDLSSFKNETKHLTRLRHTNIVNFYGLFFSPPKRVGYVCEFCQEGSLHGYLKRLQKINQQNYSDSANSDKIFQHPNASKKGRNAEQNNLKFDLYKKWDWLLQIAKGMRFLHQKGIVFRDLKPENVLIGKNEIMKITDFGISKNVNATEQNSMTRQSGTSLYMAPEVVAGKKYGFEVDVFSYAILVFEVLFETVEPYGADTPFGIEFKVSQDPNLRPKIDISNLNTGSYGEIEIAETMIEMMKKCWDHEPANRPNFREIVNSLQELEEEFEKLEEATSMY